MSAIKSKPCTVDGCTYPRFAKGFCRPHQYLRSDKKKQVLKKRSPIPAISKPQMARITKYSKVRKKYLEENPVCGVAGCCNPATEIHHKKGRIGELLWNIIYFLSVCRYCHIYIEEHPHWAKENNYSLDRL